MTTLPSGGVMLLGIPNATFQYSSVTNRWTPLANPPRGIILNNGYSIATYRDGREAKVVTACANQQNSRFRQGVMSVYNVGNDTWRINVVTNDVIRLGGCGMASLTNGGVMVVGG